MTEPKLIDPRNLYHTEKFPKQDQDTPALQQNMIPVPDCGEESYEGSNQLENRRVLITGGDSGSVVQQRLHLLEKVQTSLFNSSQEKKKMQKK